MGNRSAEVDQFLSSLAHPRQAEIERLRSIILGAHPGITEHIKWNAPSFCYGGEDRVTMRLHPPEKLQLVFHRGAKVKESTGFTFEDSGGLLKWVAADRATVTFRNLEEIEAQAGALAKVVSVWVEATA